MKRYLLEKALILLSFAAAGLTPVYGVPAHALAGNDSALIEQLTVKLTLVTRKTYGEFDDDVHEELIYACNGLSMW